MRVQLLGPVELYVGDRRLDLGPARQRRVLAALAVQPGCPVTVDELVDRVWGDRPPAQARGTLYSYVTRLRRVLAGVDPSQPGRVRRLRSGYLLDVDPHEVDVHRFRGCLATARGLVDSGDLSTAACRLADGLAQWGGVPLADQSGEWPDAIRAGLGQERLSALSLHFDIELRLGHHAAVLPELHRAVADYPFAEELVAYLMLALDGCGRHAEALAAYAHIHQWLVEELGVEPGPVLRQTHQQILRDSGPPVGFTGPAALAGPGALAGPSALAGQVGCRPTPAQLPADIADFTGRSAEVATLSAALSRPDTDRHSPAVCVITGIGGVGKTALAVYVAHAVRDRYPDGQLFANMRGADSAPVPAADVLAQFLRALGIVPDDIPETEDERAGLFRSVLAPRRVLVVLDNVSGPEAVRPLLPGVGGNAVLITSRHRMSTLTSAHTVVLPPLSALDAATLLTRAGRCGPNATRTALLRLAELCGGLPLALRVLAARMLAEPDGRLAELAGELADEHQRLGALELDDLSVRASFAMSYRSLAAGPGGRAFRLLGALDCPTPGPRLLACLLRAPLRAATAALDDLTRANLASRTRRDHIEMHDLLHLYARERAHAEAEPGQVAVALHRAVRLYRATAGRVVRLATTGRADPADPDDWPIGTEAQAADWLAAEQDNVTAIARQALTSDSPSLVQAGVGLVATLGPAFNRFGWPDCWTEVALAALDAAATAGRHDQVGHLLWSLGLCASNQGDNELAERYFTRAAAAFDRAGEAQAQISMLNNLAATYQKMGRGQDALPLLARVLALCRRFAAPRITAYALGNLSAAHRKLRHLPEAQRYAEKALRAAHDSGDWRVVIDITDELAIVHHELGDHAAALAHHGSALELANQHGDRCRIGQVLRGIADTHLARGHLDAAETAFRQSIEHLTAAGERHERALAILGLARILHTKGDPEAGRQCAEAEHELDAMRAPEATEAAALRARIRLG